MYYIESMPLIHFIEDYKMKLPRFQRKATWDKKQNFELCISVFQDYPVGVVIINQEQNVSWLLDGRQRRNALKTMRENPIEVYDWARAYIKFKQNEDEGEISRLYWNEVEKYLQTDNTLKKKTSEKNDIDEEEDINLYDDEAEDVQESSFDSEKQKQGLKTLLDLVLMVHQVKKNGSRWEKAFDFKNYCSQLRYQLKKEDYKIKPAILRSFLLDLYKSNNTLSEESVYSFFEDNTGIIEGKQHSFKKEINKNWDYIRASIETIGKTEKVFEDARIGVITLKNVSPLDAQNIFSRINTGGTQLKAEELLSAKPFWNEIVDEVNNETKVLVKAMYEKLGVEEPNGIVKWDLASTLIFRIDKKRLIFDSKLTEDEITKNQISMEKVTLGFKLISSVFQKGMSAISVTELEKNKKINWNNGIDILVSDINKVCEILMSDTFFKYLQSWDRPITKLLGNAISLEFIAILLEDWKDKEKPTVSGNALKTFQRDARILFDRLVFEYSTKVWRGSGDSKMASDIKDWKNRLKPIDKKEWNTFIIGALSGTYNGQQVSQKTLTPILYYYYALKNMEPANSSADKIDVDHIIPQEKFNNNAMVNIAMKDSLTNLALLPKNDNIAKKSKALNEIVDPWLKAMIVKYEDIPETDFDAFSDIMNFEKLKARRGENFIKTFGETRESVLAN